MDQLPQSDFATAYVAVQVHAFDEWWATGKDYFWTFSFVKHGTWSQFVACIRQLGETPAAMAMAL